MQMCVCTCKHVAVQGFALHNAARNRRHRRACSAVTRENQFSTTSHPVLHCKKLVMTAHTWVILETAHAPLRTPRGEQLASTEGQPAP